MDEAQAIPDEVVTAAVEIVLHPLGTSLRHYMPVHKAEAIEAMRRLLAAERERCALEAQTIASRYGEGAVGAVIAKAIRGEGA